MKKWMMCLTAVMAVGAMAAENVIHTSAFTGKGAFTAWGNAKYYGAYDVSFADGVAKLTVKEVKTVAKTGFQLTAIYKQGFKKGVKYKVTGVLKANRAMNVRLCAQLSGAPFTAFPQTNKSKFLGVKLQPGAAQDFAFEFVAPEDITRPCRVPGIHTAPMKAGDTLECSNVKVIEILP